MAIIASARVKAGKVRINSLLRAFASLRFRAIFLNKPI